MIIKKNSNGDGELVVTTTDKIGRADARLVTIISKCNRELKGTLNSLYSSDDVFNKQDNCVATFPWDKRAAVARIARTNAFAVEVKE